MNRTDFQGLAVVRIEEAKLLLDAGKWDGAYYLAGYAVECALKACICKLTGLHDFPPPRKIIEDCYSHDLKRLLAVAGLAADLQNAALADPALGVNWATAAIWSEGARYERKSEQEARDLYAAINDPTHGVLTWIRIRW